MDTLYTIGTVDISFTPRLGTRGLEKKMTFNELCASFPEHSEPARQVLARVHELNAIVNEIERHPSNVREYEKVVKAARSDYSSFYKKEVIDSQNPIIQALYNE